MKQYFSIIPRAYLWISVGAVVMALSAILFFTNVRYSVQFTWGIEAVVDQTTIEDATYNQLETELTDAWISTEGLSVWDKDGYATILLQSRFWEDDSDTVGDVADQFQEALNTVGITQSENDLLEFSIIGPSIGDYIKKSATTALIVGTVLMAVYILFAFSWMRKLISPAMLGVITVFTMLFDMAVPAWAYWILMALNGAVQIDTVFIIALLTVMGYSVNDTIVIFDRVRENVQDNEEAIEKGTITAKEIYETSLRQTMRRSIGTSVSTLLVVWAMYIFGTGVLQTFAFTLGLWVIAGTYSSIFLAAPLAYLASKKLIEK